MGKVTGNKPFRLHLVPGSSQLSLLPVCRDTSSFCHMFLSPWCSFPPQVQIQWSQGLCTKVSEAMNQYKNLTPPECFSQIFGHSHGKGTNACCMHVNTHRCMHIHTHRCMRVNTRLCMHVNIHLCMHVNTQLAVKCLGERDRIIVYICTCCTKLKYQAGKAW